MAAQPFSIDTENATGLSPAPALALSDLNTKVNHEPRVADVRLAEALGFERPDRIKSLIARHLDAMGRFGTVSTTMVKTSAKGGRPGKTYWLNKRQALYLCTKSEAPLATETTIAMVEIFDAYQAGQLKPVKVRAHRRSRPARFETASEYALDLLSVIRSANYRMGMDGRLDFGTALTETMEDVVARIANPLASVRGVTLDWNRERADEDLSRKLRSQGASGSHPARARRVPESASRRMEH